MGAFWAACIFPLFLPDRAVRRLIDRLFYCGAAHELTRCDHFDYLVFDMDKRAASDPESMLTFHHAVKAKMNASVPLWMQGSRYESSVEFKPRCMISLLETVMER